MAIKNEKFEIAPILKKIWNVIKDIVHGLPTDVLPLRYINIPRLQLFAMARHIFIWLLVGFTCFYKIFIFFSLFAFFVRVVPYYVLYVRIWRQFYSVWSLHILAVLTLITSYYIGALNRFILQSFIFGF